MKEALKKLDGIPTVLLGVLVLLGVAYYSYYSLENLEEERIIALVELEHAREINYELLGILRDKDGTISSFQGQISNIVGTVGTLEKLATTDEELLKKYSKIYFLNENYIPPSLYDIDAGYLLPDTKNFYIYAKVWPYLRDLLKAGESAGHDLRVASAYRDFGTQSTLKSSYLVIYGSGANTFSADQGYSEHQLGTTVDLTTVKLGTGFSAFADEPAYDWLLDNAHQHGFVLSYPEGNTYYKFEPWHWRFVGKELATYLYKEGKNFYDLDQRVIDEYLIKIFD